MKNKEKNEKIIRKTEKELNLDLASTLATVGLRGRYSSYDGWVVASTRATTIDHGLYGQSWICLVLIYDGYTVICTWLTDRI